MALAELAPVMVFSPLILVLPLPPPPPPLLSLVELEAVPGADDMIAAVG